jgi:hypothetical protein
MRQEVEPQKSNRSPRDFPTIRTAMFTVGQEAVNHLYEKSKCHLPVAGVSVRHIHTCQACYDGDVHLESPTEASYGTPTQWS